MKLILAGCEYAGTTTLANAINDWTEQVMGNRIRNIHDHFKIPQTIGHSDPDYANEEEQRQYLALSPKIMETAQRHNLYYHSPSESSSNEDRLVIGHHIDEAVYAPLYFGYGRTGENGDREVIAWQIEHKIKKFEPELVLILVKASPEVIARRMKEGAHPNAVVQEKDIELVLRRFQEEFGRSWVRNKFELDTSTATVDETITEFEAKMEPHVHAVRSDQDTVQQRGLGETGQGNPLLRPPPEGEETR